VPCAGWNRVGVIRISLFSPHRAKAQCIKAWAERRAKASGQCNEACEDSVYYRTGKLLAEDLRKSVIALEREGISSILIDLGGNGGGSEWVSLAVRAVTGSALKLPATLITKADADRRCRWEEAIVGRCSNLTPVDPDPETLAAFKENRAPRPARPLFVLVDARTASASEYFAAVLQDNNAARIIGMRTMGAGCGYVDGGGEFVLPHTNLRVRVPNCVRLRKDGSTERAGIRPDVELSSESSGIDRARQALVVASQIKP
jgi:C-terminal processing protease CtpA/Prc